LQLGPKIFALLVGRHTGGSVHQKRVGFQEFFNINFASRIFRHVSNKTPVDVIIRAVENDGVTKQTVIQGDLGGNHSRQILGFGFGGIKNGFLVIVDELRLLHFSIVKKAIGGDHPLGFQHYRTDLQTIEYS